MTYSEKRKNPLWQRKRLQVLERAQWQCQECGNQRLELHVHHVLYIAGRQPWEYPNHLLKALCQKCHMVRQEVEQEIFSNVAHVIEHMPVWELRLQPIWTMFNSPINEGGSLSWE